MTVPILDAYLNVFLILKLKNIHSLKEDVLKCNSIVNQTLGSKATLVLPPAARLVKELERKEL